MMKHLVLLLFTVTAMASQPDTTARLLETAGVKAGLVVHIGRGELRAGDRFVVEHLGEWSGERLPYVDNLVNLIVADKLGDVPMDEVLRVLAPGGVALIGGKKTVKPWPKEMDEWTHYLHGPDNNAVANDTVIGPPKHYQWIGSPDYLRHHDHMSGLSAMVSAKGRLFYIMDLGPRWSVQMPPQWTLIARDAFNGTILWQRPIARWHEHLWRLKHGPAQIMRRLVAVGETVYVTLGYGEPVSALDAATGSTLQTFAGTEGAEELIVADGILYAVVNPEGDAYKTMPKDSVEAIAAATRSWNWDEKPRRIVAIETATGKMRWSHTAPVAPGTLGTAGGRACFHDGEKVVCLEARDGKMLWSSKPVPRWKPMHVLFSPTLIVRDDVVLFAGGEKFDPQRGGKDTMTAFSAKTGETLWTAPHPPSGYASAEDLFVINNLVWCGDTSSPRDTGTFTGRDLLTGEVKVEWPPDPWRHMPHHRCYRGKATCNFILTSRTGIEFMDVRHGGWTPHFWVRGSCNYGILPANGLIYAGPHSCACFLLAKLNGMNALAPERKQKAESRKHKDQRLQRGPAYSEISNLQSPISDADWPTFRHDESRSGATKTSVPVNLKQTWKISIGGKLSAMTVADEKLFVASVDAHIVHALDAPSGKPLWNFATGGRVDSPPTIWQGRVLFGSADGYVYCLRASDGALVWKFRAAPEDLRLMAHEQIESVWPVHGSVLVRDGIVYAVAGRAMWLDGGMRFVRLDAATGNLLSEAILDDKYPGTQDNLQKDVKWPNLPVALPDILSCDGKYIYMRSQHFDFEGNRPEVVTPRDYTLQRGETAHLFSATGFLDDSWWHRTYWMWGRSFISAAGGWQLATYRAPAGKILVCDEDSVFGYGPAPLKFLGTPVVNHLFACPKEPKIINPNPKAPPRKQGKTVYGDVVVTRLNYDWSQAAPFQARGLVLAGETLFAAGPPVVVDEQDVFTHYGDAAVQAKMAEHVAAFEGHKGALLMAVSKKDGKQLAAYRLDSPPVFDGMIAANGCLFVATMDGSVLCLGKKGKPLPAASDAKLAPVAEITTASRSKTAAPVALTTSHPDFQKIENLRIEKCDIGYRLQPPRGATGFALKKLEKPLTGRVSFRLKIRTTPGSSPDQPGNGFLVFGDSPEDAKLIKCGYRISGRALEITQGSGSGKTGRASQKADLKANEVTDVRVVADLAAQKVTLSARGQTLEAPLARRVDAIHWIGYCVSSVTSDFSVIEILP